MKNLALLFAILALPVMALQNSTPAVFVPTPMKAEAPMRLYMGLDNGNVFSGGESVYPGTFLKNGQVGLMSLQLQVALIKQMFAGFDVGFAVHGGLQSPYSMFFGEDKTGTVGFPRGATRYGMMIGMDLMARYMKFVTEMFYMGVQAQVGYTYSDTAPGIGNSADSLAGKPWFSPYTSQGVANSFIPVNAGLVFGWQFNKSLDFYLFPAVELGQMGNQTNTSDPGLTGPQTGLPSNPDTGIWKSAVGMNVATGVAFNMGYCKVVVQLKPRIANFNNGNSWGLDMYTGGSFDF
jgi:hypothetical protein